MTSHQLLIKLLFFMICSRAFANECYVGTKTAVRTDALVKTEVSVPLCGLKAKYEDSECEYDGEIQLTAEVSPETNKPSTSSMNKYKGGVCFFRNLSVSCICYGHLCNNAIGMKEILATQLARRPPKSAQKLIMCFLFRDEISPLFGQTRLFTGPTNTHPENELQGEESTHDYDDTKEATQEEHTTHPHVSDDDEKDTTRFAMDNETLVILTLAVGVAAFMLICMIIIFFVMTVVYMVKSRKVKKFIKEKEEKLERSKKAKSSSKTKSRSLTSSKRSDKDNSARRGAGGDRNRRSKSGSSKTAPSSEPDLYRDYENN